MKTSELTGAALDWAVAKCEGNKWARFQPSTDWSQGGPIIERERISIKAQQPDWTAYISICDGMTDRVLRGPTPLIAAMRCYVTSKLGDEIESPEGL